LPLARGFDSAMKSLALRVLSGFGVDGVEPQALGSRKGRLALCVLALGAGQQVPGDVLADTLWGDSPPARPEDQVAVLISRLRSVLGRERIQRRDGGYMLVCDWLDASELAALTEEMDRRRAAGNILGAAAAARIALSLLRGYAPPPVPGEWAQLRLAELDRLAGRARQLAATILLEAGDWMAAADAATAAVAADGYDEASLRVLLRAYVAGGRVAAALAAYAQARERLATELGTDPSPETVGLYTAVLRGELPVPPPAPARGPAGLVGRDEELAYLDTISSSWTGKPASGRPRWSAPGPPSGTRPAMSCCWPPAASSTGPCRWMPCSARCPPCCGASVPKPLPTCSARTHRLSRRCSAPVPWRAGPS